MLPLFPKKETLLSLLSTGIFPGTDSSVISQSNLDKLRALCKIDLNVK